MVNIIHLNTLLGVMITMVLYLELSQMTSYINNLDKNRITMSLKVKDKRRFKNYNKIWKKN